MSVRMKPEKKCFKEKLQAKLPHCLLERSSWTPPVAEGLDSDPEMCVQCHSECKPEKKCLKHKLQAKLPHCLVERLSWMVWLR